MAQLQTGSFEHIPLSAIRPSTTNPRKHFDQAAMDELTQSIAELGVTDPIHVRSLDEYPVTEPEIYELVAGERRFRAAEALGLEEIPAIVHEGMSDAEAMTLQIVENLQRADLHPMEEAEGYRALLAGGGTAEDVAKKSGETLGRCMGFLKDAASDADILVSPFIKQGKTRTPGVKRKAAHRREEKPSSKATPPNQPPAPAQVHTPPPMMPAQASMLLWGLFQRLPKPGTPWAKFERDQWESTLRNVLVMEYPEG